jgi:hypothetical protein
MTAFLRAAAVVLFAVLVEGTRNSPAAQNSPPAFAELFTAVRENLARAQQSAHLYSYKERRTILHTNPFGKLGTDGTRVRQVYPSAIPQLTHRLTIERDGKPVSEVELAAETRQYRQRVAAFERALATESQAARCSRQQQVTRRRERAREVVDDVLATLEFRVEGSAMHSGVDTWVVKFVPRPNAQPRTREGKLAQQFVGTAWVHKEQDEVMRVEATATKDLTIGWGVIARVNKGATGSITRRQVDERFWMPSEVRLTGQGRAMLFRRLTINYVTEWFDYERIPAGSPASLDADSWIEGKSQSCPQ